MSASTLTPGARHASTITVEADMTPEHLRPIVVLSTPTMIGLMEEAATRSVQPLLEDRDQTTVGTHVDVSHESAAREGEEVTVEAELVAVDGPRLTYSVVARVGDRIIGRGTHRRHIVDRARFSRG